MPHICIHEEEAETFRICSFIVGNIVSSVAALVVLLVALVSVVMQAMEMEPFGLCCCGNFSLFYDGVESVVPVHPALQPGLGEAARQGVKPSLKPKQRISEINKNFVSYQLLLETFK